METISHPGADPARPNTLPRDVSATFCPQNRRRHVLFAAILASALGFIDGSVVSVAMPAIRADLGASLADAQWISNAYALTLSALILVGGGAGDRFGLRRTFIAGIVLFVLASMICAAVPTAGTLILARGVQGVGAALMIPGSLAIIAKAYPKGERGRAIGIWAAASALTTAIGPVIGGGMLSVLGDGAWRLIFAINLPLGAIAVALLLRVPDDPPGERRRLDFGGAALAILAFGALAWGLTDMVAESGSPAPYRSITASLIGLGALTIFVVYELRVKAPMVNLSLFSILPFAGANAATFVLYFALSANLFYLPMLLIAGWGIEPATAGFVFLPLSASIALLSGPVGRLSDRYGPRLPITAGSAMVGCAFAGLAVAVGMGLHLFWEAVFPLMIVMGLGMSLVVSPLSTAVMTSVEDDDTGAASGINNAIARIAGLVAVAAMGSLAALVYASHLGEAPDHIPGFGEPASGLPAASEAMRLAAGDAAFAAIAWTIAACCLLAALLAWTTQTAVRPEKG
ncbi:MFS transporter [Pseudohoeflea suaedae]|uniref:MFS transporter n=1 Tax=Pseudohoeflea suaedae TaxID=877384 RepID=A0A4R5PM21_9HYPH|nr:MFS transporter [Pseudohoeflea suaedae]TDH37983.1 MFS transporter [Pseudohoeflea suaedae]